MYYLPKNGDNDPLFTQIIKGVILLSILGYVIYKLLKSF